MAKVKTYFVVSLGDNGIVTTYPDILEEGLEAERPVNNYDIYTAAKQIVDEFESSILAQKVADTVIAILNPEVPTASDKVKDALKERGIKTDSK